SAPTSQPAAKLRQSSPRRTSQARSVYGRSTAAPHVRTTTTRRRFSIVTFLSRRLNHSHDRAHHPFELFRLYFHMLVSTRSQPVIPRAPVLIGHAPLRFHPALHQHPLECRI